MVQNGHCNSIHTTPWYLFGFFLVAVTSFALKIITFVQTCSWYITSTFSKTTQEIIESKSLWLGFLYTGPHKIPKHALTGLYLGKSDRGEGPSGFYKIKGTKPLLAQAHSKLGSWSMLPRKFGILELLRLYSVHSLAHESQRVATAIPWGALAPYPPPPLNRALTNENHFSIEYV